MIVAQREPGSDLVGDCTVDNMDSLPNGLQRHPASRTLGSVDAK